MSIPDDAAPEDATLMTGAPASPGADDLLEQVCTELVECWRAGRRIPAEDFLGRHPALQGDADTAFELVYVEFVLRESLGESPDIREYDARFPQFAGRLRRQLELHGALLPTMTGPRADRPGGKDSEVFLPAAPPSMPGYEVLGELGRGGMGIVYKARHLKLNRVVALKVIRADTAAAGDQAARFRAEAEAAARLQHPNIVQVFEIGEHEGTHYLALEYVAGGNLQQRFAGTPQDPRVSAQLVEAAARAIHYAHQHGVIHRDLKPANILLQSNPTTDDTDSTDKKQDNHSSSVLSVSSVVSLVPKIADFGLAKMLERDRGETLAGMIMGTPSYMAPEQARAGGARVSPATDVYALGAILYECLTGHPPFLGSTPLSTLEQVCSQDPLPPSKLQRRTPRDLETICLKCLQKEPHRRYASAGELADDLRRFVQGRPIKARRAGRVERLWRWCRREPGKAGLVAALLLVLVGGVAGVLTQWLRAEAEAEAQARARGRAESAEAEVAAKMNAEARARSEADRAKAEAQEHLYLSLVNQARLEWRTGNVVGAGQLLGQCEPRLRGWEWHYLRGVTRPDILGSPGLGVQYTSALAFSPDGRLLAFTGHGAPFPVEVWDTRTGKRLHRAAGPVNALRLEFSPDGRYLAVSGEYVIFWDLEAGGPGRGWKSRGTAAFSPVPLDGPAGRWCVACGTPEGVVFHEAATGRELRRFPAARGRVTFRPDGKQLAVSGPWGVEIYDVAAGRRIRLLPRNGGVDPFFSAEGPNLAYSPDGRHIAVATTPPQVWEVESGKPLHTLTGHTGIVTGVAFRPDGLEVATAGSDGTVRLWDARTGIESLILRGHAARASFLAYHPEGWCLASGGRQPPDVLLWDLTRHPDYLTLHGVNAAAVAFDPLGRRVRAVDLMGRLQAREVVGGVTRYSTRLDMTTRWQTPAQSAAFSADGRRVATITEGRGLVKVWAADGGRELGALRGLGEPGLHVALSGDGARAAVAAIGGRQGAHRREVRAWDVATGKPLQVFRPAAAPVAHYHGAVALSPDGRLLAYDDYMTEPHEGKPPLVRALVRVHDAESGRERFTLPAPPEMLECLAFSWDGRLLAAGGRGQRVAVWDTASGARLHKEELAGPAFRLAFSPDGRRLAGLDRERLVVWDVRSGKGVLSLRNGPPPPNDGGSNPTLAWSGDGRWLAASVWHGDLSALDGGDGGKSSATGTHGRVPFARVFAWHMRQANAALNAQAPGALAFHLERLNRAEPPDRWERLRRGQLLARLARWEQAAADFARAFDNFDPDSQGMWEDYAHALLMRKDVKAYRALCARLTALPRVSGLGWNTAGAARAAALAPGGAANPARVVQMAEQAGDGVRESPESLFVRGLAHYRARQWDKAGERLRQSAAGFGAPHGPVLVVQAMLHHQLGQAEEARGKLDAATAWRTEARRRHAEAAPAQPFEGAWADFELLYAEAAALLGAGKR